MVMIKVLLTLVFVGATGSAQAQAGGPAGAPNREDMASAHRKMSEAHAKMAECLASDRPLTECQGEMRTTCSEMGMMGHGTHGKHMKGMMGGADSCPMMMMSPPAKTGKAKPQK